MRTQRLGIGDFEGRWRLTRHVEDQRDLGPGEGTGEAEISSGDGQWRYSEKVQMAFGAGPALLGTRVYLWVPRAQEIAVKFEDGRDFHVIDLAGAEARTEHWCDPDTYRVAYDFGRWPNWSARWVVTGPRKDYVMTTRYSRAG